MLCDSLPPKSRPSTILAESQNHRRFVQPFQLQLLDSLHGESRMRLPASHYSVYNHRPVIIAQPLTTLRHSGQLLSSTLALMAGCCSALISDGALAAYMSGSLPGDAPVLGCPVRSAPLRSAKIILPSAAMFVQQCTWQLSGSNANESRSDTNSR